MITVDEITLPMTNINHLQRHSILRSLKLNNSLAKEPISTKDATNRAIRILDAKYNKADCQSIVVNIRQMTARFPKDDCSTLLVEDNKPSDENSTDSSYCEETCKISSINKEERYVNIGRLSIEQGWKWVTKFKHLPPSKADHHLYCALQCDQCSPNGLYNVYVPSKEFYHSYRRTTAWWEVGFICGFLAMANHDVHCEPPPFKKEDMKIKMVMQPSPKDEVEPECVLSCEDATHFLTPAFNHGHFVVLLYNLQECTVTVFDGLYMDIKHSSSLLWHQTT